MTLYNTFLIVKTIFIIALMSHWTAMGFYLISYQYRLEYEDVWIRNGDIITLSVIDVYVTSVYWAFTTMTTVGYGDLTP